MTGARCTVAVCNNSYEKTKGSGISYHKFPKNPDIRNVWVQRCYRDGKWDPTNLHICSVHFKSDDFERNLKAELLSLNVKKKLKPTAVPSLNLKKTADRPLMSKRDERMVTRDKKALVKDMLEMPGPEPCPSVSVDCVETHMDVEQNWEQKYKILLTSNEDMRKELLAMENNMKTKMTENVKLCKQLNNARKLVAKETEKNKNVQMELQKILSKCQLDIVLHHKKRVVWASDDISNAFTIRYFSKRCYMFLRNTLKYPLPHNIASLQRWASRLRLRNGLLRDVLRIMKIAAYTATDIEKVVILQFDEMKVRSLYEYDSLEDQIVGRHSQMQVVMARGLFKNWKQPVYINFDTKMTKDLLIEIIKELQVIGYSVVSCVSDCGGGNVGLWKELGITVEHHYFNHPVTNQKIFFFADAPHILKLVRNWLLDVGFDLQDGGQVRKDPLQALITSATATEISSCHQLTLNHIECENEKTKRQNVRLAAQLLSHSTATALIHYKPGDNKKLAEDTGHFIEIINAWFDIMNSYTPSASQPYKQPYGLNLPIQDELLDKAFATIYNMRCISKRSLQIFQKGMLLSINSLKGLLTDMKDRYNIRYILTHRVNQDSLENLFSQIRSRGGLNDHPSPLDAVYRLRMIILGKNPGIIQEGTNTRVAEDEFLVSQVFEKADISPTSCPQTEILKSPPEAGSSSPSSESSGRTDDLTKIQEDDGFRYLCGWIAKKFKSKYSYLGEHTYKQKQDHSYGVPASWIQHLSFGGLMEPSDAWVSQAKLLDKAFLKYHKDCLDGLNRDVHVTKRLIQKMATKHPDISPDIIQSFIKQRTFIRIKFLNIQRSQNQLSKRKADEPRKLAKKYKIL